MPIGLFDILRYSDNCRAVLRKVLEENPGTFGTPIGTTSVYNTIRRLLSHIAGAEERWIEKRIGGREIVNYEERAAGTIDGVFADWDAIRERTRAYMDGLGPGGLDRVYHLQLGSPAAGSAWEGDLTVEQILFHIFNHETHHRAQISMALQQQGVVPPDFDYVFHHG